MAELFAREKQHEPRAMLKDVIALYCLAYDMNIEQATRHVRADALELRKQWEKAFRAEHGKLATLEVGDLPSLTP